MSYTYQPGVQVAHDEFTGTTAGSNLTGRTLPLGGTWTEGGNAGNLTFADAPGTEETITRAGTSEAFPGRMATVGTTSYTDMEVGFTAQSTSPSYGNLNLIARWVDNSNYLVGALTSSSIQIIKVVAGAATVLKTLPFTRAANTWYRPVLIAYASGRAILILNDANGSKLALIAAQDSVIATGGALATGRPGLMDQGSGAGTSTRYYNSWYGSLPSAEQVVMNPGKQMEVRFDGAQRQDSSGVWGPIVARGKPLYLPPAGGPNRSTRITVMAHRNDLSTEAWEPLGDSLQAQVTYVPRYIAVPR
jgi:hypothetical protein